MLVDKQLSEFVKTLGTVKHRGNLTACKIIKTITQEVGRKQGGMQTVTNEGDCTTNESHNHTAGGGKEGDDLSHSGRGFSLDTIRQ